MTEKTGYEINKNGGPFSGRIENYVNPIDIYNSKW